ncbi:protein LATERAL ORGAN BOUNDARIES-like [Daucus carota subsp. sativus]|uniref:protein LATERAL ORGAN BOUNDARIES-like n=1 Tax=Daucus carota subsp. sativus TaxID=79200 RepID=UPI0007EF5A69|nr:PREDICTED: protein LATERAL ORGAN BOUNDARIES-like [Daucus carota subsp. sativus]
MAASFNIIRYNYSACAACKLLKRKCLPDCIFAPHFPPEELQKFISVHKIFGTSNVAKLLNKVLPHQREETVSSLSYEAEARLRDPVYGCVGTISILQLQVERLQKELDQANAELGSYASGHHPDICGSSTTATGGTGGGLWDARAPSNLEKIVYNFFQYPQN